MEGNWAAAPNGRSIKDYVEISFKLPDGLGILKTGMHFFHVFHRWDNHDLVKSDLCKDKETCERAGLLTTCSLKGVFYVHVCKQASAMQECWITDHLNDKLVLTMWDVKIPKIHSSSWPHKQTIRNYSDHNSPMIDLSCHTESSLGTELVLSYGQTVIESWCVVFLYVTVPSVWLHM